MFAAQGIRIYLIIRGDLAMKIIDAQVFLEQDIEQDLILKHIEKETDV